MIGMSIVFLVLLVMYLIFNNTPILFKPAFRQKMERGLAQLFARKGSEKAELPLKDLSALELSGEVNAAIAAAIHLYRSELHDLEDTVLTIKKVSRTYSPWSSKIYGIQNNVTRK